MSHWFYMVFLGKRLNGVLFSGDFFHGHVDDDKNVKKIQQEEGLWPILVWEIGVDLSAYLWKV